jgi:competence protein ComEC
VSRIHAETQPIEDTLHGPHQDPLPERRPRRLHDHRAPFWAADDDRHQQLQEPPEDDEVALAESKGISLSQFRVGTAYSRSWEEYHRSLLFDPRDYWRTNFADRMLFRYMQTRPDMDHMSGLASLFWGEKVSLGNFWDYDHGKTASENSFDKKRYDWNDWLAYQCLRSGQHGDGTTHAVIKRLREETGDFWTEDGLTILGPTQDLIDYGDCIEHWHNASYVLRLDYGGRRVILPGDAEKPA